MATLRQQIGQMLIMGFNGLEITKDNPVYHWLTTDGLGGVLLFDIDLTNNNQPKNLISKSQIVHLTNQLQSLTAKKLPLLIAIDYEGGVVDRLKNVPDCMKTMTPLALGALPANERQNQIESMAATLKSLGFNLNFAPLVDLDLDNKNGIIGKLGRSFSADPQKVAVLAKDFVKIFDENGISCCFKHFPGHGSAVGDSHEGFVDVSDTWQVEELDPYHLLSQENNQQVMVMTAHVINRQLDASGIPATLSHKILTGILRDKIGFNGVIISDDLQMKAISDHFSMEDALKLTINAGADMVIFGNQLGSISATTVIDIVENLVKSNQIPASRIEEAFQRVVWLKQSQSVLA